MKSVVLFIFLLSLFLLVPNTLTQLNLQNQSKVLNQKYLLIIGQSGQAFILV